MCLAAFYGNSFLSLSEDISNSYVDFTYLRDISQYNDFLRLIVMQWLYNGYQDLSPACSFLGTGEGSPGSTTTVRKPDHERYTDDTHERTHSSDVKQKFLIVSCTSSNRSNVAEPCSNSSVPSEEILTQQPENDSDDDKEGAKKDSPASHVKSGYTVMDLVFSCTKGKEKCNEKWKHFYFALCLLSCIDFLA